MSTTPVVQKLTAKALFGQENVKAKFQELLGKNAPAFITSVLQVVSSNDLLAKAEPNSIFHAAAVAATLNLPINNNLGFAYIIPFNDRKSGTTLAQFQLGYKGFIQLAQRSGQFENIGACPVFEGQIEEANPLTGYKFNWSKKTSDRVVGYAAYFKLLNGFEKTLFMTKEELNQHGVKYSQTFKKGFGLWKEDFDAMAIKTVIKLLLSKYAPLSIEMQKAVITDQAIVNNEEATDITYIDNTPEAVNKEEERISLLIDDATDLEQLDKIYPNVPDTLLDKFLTKKEDLSHGK